MITQKTQLLDAMLEAYRMEKGLFDFYIRAAGKAREPEVRDVFEVLSRWEDEHMRYVQFLYQAIRDERETLSFQDFGKKVQADHIEGGIPVAEANRILEDRPIQSDKHALGLALEIEQKAADLYRRIAGSTEDTNTSAFMRDMVTQEERHISYIQGALANLPA